MKYILLILIAACTTTPPQTSCTEQQEIIRQQTDKLARQDTVILSLRRQLAESDLYQMEIDSISNTCPLRVVRTDDPDRENYLIYLPVGYYSCGNSWIYDHRDSGYIFLCTAKW